MCPSNLLYDYTTSKYTLYNFLKYNYCLIIRIVYNITKRDLHNVQINYVHENVPY